MNRLSEAATQAAQSADLTASAVRQAHSASCDAGGPMELLLREALLDAVKLAQRLHELAGFAEQRS